MSKLLLCYRRWFRTLAAAMRNVRKPRAVAELLDAHHGWVELVAGDVRVGVHRAVLEDRSPVMAAMLRDTPGDCQLTLQDVEGAALPQLVEYLYTLRLCRLRGRGAQLLAIADRYDVLGLRTACQQLLGGRG